MSIKRPIRSLLLSLLPAAIAASIWLSAPCIAQDSQKIEDIKLVGPENLGFFAEKVRKHEPVIIAYLGGSITVGAGSSQYGNNYYWKSRTAIIDEIKKRGGSAESLNVGIGGTGSAYGAYRIGSQLLVNKPDLLIVEFAVNDCPGKREDALTQKKEMVDGMEGIVRQALKQNPKIGIVFLYTSAATFQEQYYSKGLVTPSVEAHHSVALHYGITEAISGSQIDKGLKDGTFNLKAFFPDGTHPSDIGHDLYATTLTSAILPGFDQPAPASVKALPPLLGSGKYENARLDPIVPAASSEGWASNKKQWNWNGVEIWTCDVAEKPISFIPKGNGIQLIFMGKIKVKWTVDGKENVQELTSHAAGMPMPSGWTFPADKNPDGKTVSVEVVSTPDGKPHGEVWGIFSTQKP